MLQCTFSLYILFQADPNACNQGTIKNETQTVAKSPITLRQEFSKITKVNSPIQTSNNVFKCRLKILSKDQLYMHRVYKSLQFCTFYPAWNSLVFFNWCLYIFHWFWKTHSCYLFKYYFCLNLFCSLKIQLHILSISPFLHFPILLFIAFFSSLLIPFPIY